MFIGDRFLTSFKQKNKQLFLGIQIPIIEELILLRYTKKIKKKISFFLKINL